MITRALFVDMRAEGGGHPACMASISSDRKWAAGWELIRVYARRLEMAGIRVIYVEQEIDESELWCGCADCDRNTRLASQWLRQFEAPTPTG